jgi:hypothetical protein
MLGTRKKRILAGAAAAALVLAAGAATAEAAGAATPSCGVTCVEPFTHEWGHNQVLDARGGGFGHATQEVILFRASHDDMAEDFTFAFQGQVSTLVGFGLLHTSTLVHYAADTAWELEYSPLGVNSGLCVGTWPQHRDSFGLQPQVPSGWRLRLFPCGEGANTIWIVDHPNVDGNAVGFATIISGTTTNFSHPRVWDYPGGATPFDFPRPDMIVSTQETFSFGQHPDAEQVGARFGILP